MEECWFWLYPATLLKLTLLHGCFSRFLNCINATKSRNAPHMGPSALQQLCWFIFTFILNLDEKRSNACLFAADHNKRIQTTILLNYFELPLLTLQRNKKFSIFCKTGTIWSPPFWPNPSHIICSQILPNRVMSLAPIFYFSRLLRWYDSQMP